MSTIEDVARHVGVSTATVSRALRGLPRVSPGTRARVLAAAEELHYVASASAASLASGTANTVGIVVPFVERWFFGTVVQGAEEVLRAEGYDVLLYNLAGDVDARDRVFRTQLLRKRVDAVLLLTITVDEAERALLERLRLPVVAVGEHSPGVPTIGIDDPAAVRLAVTHLVELGHERIGYLGGDPYDARGFSAPRLRRDAFRDVLREHGLSTCARLEASGNFTVPGGTSAMRYLLDAPDPPTAVFAASDEMALGALHALRLEGVRVPDEMSVIGIDDHEMAELFDLSTVRQPVLEQGRLAARLLLDALRGCPPGDSVRRVPVELVVRGTTGPRR